MSENYSILNGSTAMALMHDGEPKLIKVFSMCFPKAVDLRCTNHICQNIKDKLRMRA